MQLTPETFEAIRLHFCAAYPNEGCGLVLKDGSFIACENVAANTARHFAVADEVFLEHEAELAAVVHSHSLAEPTGPYSTPDPRMPSGADLQGHIDTAVPWGITSCDGENIDHFIWLGETHTIPLEGRNFLHGYLDCYSACRDWYRIERDLILPDFAREWGWWNDADADSLYLKNFEKAGFYTISEQEAKVGDAVLMRVATRMVNHAAVIVGPNEVFHHVPNRLSAVEGLGRYLTKGAVIAFVRHKTLNQD